MRRVRVPILLGLATVLTIVGTLAVWVNRQALQTDHWTELSVELLDDDAVRSALASYLAEEVVGAVDVEAALADRLPPAAEGLAPVAAGLVQERAPVFAERLLSTPQAETLWREANRRSHERLVQLLTDEDAGGEIISREGGSVVIDLQPLADRVRDRLGIGDRLGITLRPTAARLEIIDSDEVESAQTAAKLLRALAWVLPLLALALFGAAIALAAPGRRSRTLVYAGGLVALSGLAVLLVRRVLGDVVVGALAEEGTGGDAAASVWRIGTSLLASSAQALVVFGLVAMAAGWLASPGRRAIAARARVAPTLRESPGVAYGVVIAAFLVLVLWAPVPALGMLLPALILLGLLLAWVTALRRQVLAHP